MESFEDVLQDLRKSPMGKLWTDCLIVPAIIVHMHATIFLASGHIHYARYIAWHLSEMQYSLSEEASVFYEIGDHVCCQKSGTWRADLHKIW